MTGQVPVSSDALAERFTEDGVDEVLPDVAYRRLAIVNVAFVGEPDAWVLLDAGLKGTAGLIKASAEGRFGKGAKPAAILLTHGHFDHVGALAELAEDWKVAIYAHALEHPYLSGAQSYAPPDPKVGGGLMALVAPLYPRGPIDVTRWLRPLPADGSVPHLEGWQWVHTPGHTPGHVSFWRERDRTLLAGDAVITTKQESAYAVLRQRPEVHGPPMYYTPDWNGAGTSVTLLSSLEPNLLLTGHGPPLEGPEMRQALHILAERFGEIAVPK